MSDTNLLDYNSFDLLIRPIISEKATLISSREAKQYLFLVSKDATKLKIKSAVEKIFNVEVQAVNICNRLGKLKRRGNRSGRRAFQRRAYVSLKAEQQINLDASSGAK